MPIRSLLRYLLNNEQMIQKLADSKPVRRAAQLTVFVSQKAKESGFDSVSKFSEGFKQGETNASKPVRRRK